MNTYPDAFRMALYGNDLQEICEHLQAGANANQRFPDGSTPLLEAQTYELAKALLECGASVHAVDRLGRTVMHHLAFADHPERMALLFNRMGTPLEERDGDGRTPLLMVLAENQTLPEAAMALLSLGADPYACDAQGNNALHCWAMGRAVARVGNWLINEGVDPAAKNKFGQTANDLLLAEGQGDKIGAIGMLGAVFDRGELELTTPQVAVASRARRI